MLHTVYFSLGSNLGNRKKFIQDAISLLETRVGQVVACSSLIETEPWGFDSSNHFINACVKCMTNLSPKEILCITQDIEKEMGRTKKTAKEDYHDRTIDIDILLYDRLEIDEPGLKIPHPKMKERDFVMIPLREICPDVFVDGDQ